jgi:hypothetical protein
VLATAMALAPAPVWAAAPAAGASSTPEGLIQPVPLNRVSFEYPEELVGTEGAPAGRVIVKYVVGVDGVPKELEVVESVDPRVDEVALEAIAALRYQPASYQGQPVEIVLSIALDVVAPELPEPEPPEGEDPDQGEGTLEGPEGEPGVDSEGSDDPSESGPVRIEGTILAAGDRRKVEGVTVLAVPGGDHELGEVKRKVYGADEAEPEYTLRAVTDTEGKFELRGVPDGRVRLIMLAQGYERLEWVVELEQGRALEVKYFQKPLNVNPYRTEVAVDRETMPEISSHKISMEETNAIPGTQGDALKGVQNFPGIARAPFGAGMLAIRGAAPEDSAVFLGYHEIPNLYHFGGLTSTFNSDILAQIDYVPGNFDARYGDAIGGIVNVVPRRGRVDGYHGYIDSDLFDTGVLFEGPFNPKQKNPNKRASFVISGRRSYVDLLLPVIIPPEAGLKMTVAPRYWDYQVLADVPVSGGTLTTRVFGSDDRTKLIFTEENEVDEDDRNAIESVVYFHRADLVYRKVDGPWEFLVTPSYKREYWSGSGFGDFSFEVTYDTVSARAEISRALAKRSRLRIGTDLDSRSYDFSVTAGPWDSDTGGGVNDLVAANARRNQTTPALYSTLILGVTEKFTLLPGIRFSYYAHPVERGTVDPKLRFSWQLFENTMLKGGVGMYAQGPRPEHNDPVFGNPRLGPERALHTSLSVQQTFPQVGASLELTGFYKKLEQLVTYSDDAVIGVDGSLRPEYFANQGDGRIYGLEFLARKDLVKNLFGWVSYTLMRSERRTAPGEPYQLFDFDQTHILTVIASYKLPFNWQIGVRFRAVTGNPTTARTDGVHDASDGGYFPVLGPTNGSRMPGFHQLDLRIDKTWIKKRVRITSYLDIQNVYNAENVELFNYSYNYQDYVTVNSLPTAPSIGLKLEF